MNAEQIKLFLHEGEGLTVEFKEKFSSHIDEDIVAFANTKGGTLLLGVRDNGVVVGERLTNDLKGRINSIARNCKPSISVNVSQNENIVAIEVPEGSEKPYSCGSGYYRRLNGNTQKMSHDEIRVMFRENDVVSFEEKPVHRLSIDDISRAKVLKFTKEAGIRIGKTSTKDFLQSLNATDKGRVNAVGALFFARELRKYLPQSRMTLLAFRGTEKFHIFDRRDVQDDLLTQFNEAIRFLERHLNVRSEIKGVNREDIVEIPLEALREAVVNALMHRDYSITGTQVSVEIYDDRIEISNPGGLPNGLTKKAFGTMSVRRNELISDLFFRLRKVERVGMGIKRMRGLVKSAGLKEPQFETNGFFRVVFHRPMEPAEAPSITPLVSPPITPPLGLTELEGKIYLEIAKNPKISRNQIAKALNIKLDTVKEYIGRLKEKRLLRRLGKTRAGRWEVSK